MAKDCPELEVLAAYIDHALYQQEREKLESHLVQCRLCRTIVALTIKSKDEVPDPLPLNSKPS